MITSWPVGSSGSGSENRGNPLVERLDHKSPVGRIAGADVGVAFHVDETFRENGRGGLGATWIRRPVGGAALGVGAAAERGIFTGLLVAHRDPWVHGVRENFVHPCGQRAGQRVSVERIGRAIAHDDIGGVGIIRHPVETKADGAGEMVFDRFVRRLEKRVRRVGHVGDPVWIPAEIAVAVGFDRGIVAVGACEKKGGGIGMHENVDRRDKCAVIQRVRAFHDERTLGSEVDHVESAPMGIRVFFTQQREDIVGDVVGVFHHVVVRARGFGGGGRQIAIEGMPHCRAERGKLRRGGETVFVRAGGIRDVETFEQFTEISRFIEDRLRGGHSAGEKQNSHAAGSDWK